MKLLGMIRVLRPCSPLTTGVRVVLIFYFSGYFIFTALQPRPRVANLFKGMCQKWLNQFKSYPCMPIKIVHSISLFLSYTFYVTERSKKLNKTLYHCISGTWSCAGHDWMQTGSTRATNLLHVPLLALVSWVRHLRPWLSWAHSPLPFDRAVESEGCTQGPAQ